MGIYICVPASFATPGEPIRQCPSAGRGLRPLTCCYWIAANLGSKPVLQRTVRWFFSPPHRRNRDVTHRLSSTMCCTVAKTSCSPRPSPMPASPDARISKTADPNPCSAAPSVIRASGWGSYIWSTAKSPGRLAGRSWNGCGFWPPNWDWRFGVAD
jgi:hypothetical protein